MNSKSGADDTDPSQIAPPHPMRTTNQGQPNFFHTVWVGDRRELLDGGIVKLPQNQIVLTGTRPATHEVSGEPTEPNRSRVRRYRDESSAPVQLSKALPFRSSPLKNAKYDITWYPTKCFWAGWNRANSCTGRHVPELM